MMQKLSSFILLALAFASCTNNQNNMSDTISPADTIETLAYPKTAKGDVIDDYFGTKVPDPYRWLENDTSAETKAWVIEENKVTDNYLSKIPYRDDIKKRLEILWNYEKYSAPFKEGKYTYFYKNDGLQNQSVLYRQIDDSEPEIFLDPNTFSKDGTTSLAGIEFSRNGNLAAYQLSEGGSDWRKVIVIKTEDKSSIGDTLVDVKFTGLAWRGSEGFYYSSYDKPTDGSQLSGLTQYHKLYFHQLGTPQTEDKLIFGGNQTQRRYIGAYLTEDERYLVITAANSTTGNELYFKDLTKPNSGIVKVVGGFDTEQSIIANNGSTLYIYTNYKAPNYRLVTVNAANPTKDNWKDLIPETENVMSASIGGGKIFANYLKDATSLVVQYDLKGVKEREIALPGIGTASGFDAKKDDKELYFNFTSYVYPSTIFKYTVLSKISIEDAVVRYLLVFFPIICFVTFYCTIRFSFWRNRFKQIRHRLAQRSVDFL